MCWRKPRGASDELGLMPVTAVELEFYLLDRAADAQGRPQPPLFATSGRRATETQCYSMDDLDDARAVLDDIAAACAVQSIPASVATSEYAPSQFEINLAHQPDALRACDQAVLLKRAIKGVARRHGLEATFMAKPLRRYRGQRPAPAHQPLGRRTGATSSTTARPTARRGCATRSAASPRP